MKIYLDMDGVICNLGIQLELEIKKLLNSSRIESNSTSKIITKIKNHKLYETTPIDYNFLKNIFIKKDLSTLNQFEKLVSNLSYKPLFSNVDIWQRLQKYEAADELVHFLIGNFGTENVRILTAPIDDDCIVGKKKWLLRHYPYLLESALFEINKYKYADSKSLIIDDRPKNTFLFIKNGGKAIHHKTCKETIQILKEQYLIS